MDAVCAGRDVGFVKLIADPKGRLVGATVAAPAGGETIAELAGSIATGGRIGDISELVHAYPTFGRGVKHAADQHLRERWLTDLTRRFAAAARAPTADRPSALSRVGPDRRSAIRMIPHRLTPPAAGTRSCSVNRRIGSPWGVPASTATGREVRFNGR